MIRSLLQYARYFTKARLSSEVWRVVNAQRKGIRPDRSINSVEALSAIADHFCRAQDHGGDDGLGSYHLIHGWGASYPETTGYIIPTLIGMAHHLEMPELIDRAIRAGDWLLSIQRADGGWQGGRVNENRPSIVFNTAQVIRGMIALHASTADRKYLDPAMRAADWIVSVQEANGAWQQHNFLQQARVYDTYVSAPLLHLHRVTGKDAYRSAALKNLEHVLTEQQPNGFFRNADNTIRHNDRPITHTIAYTLDGLLGSYTFTQDQRYLAAVRKAADRLLEIFMRNGALHGRYDQDWNGSEHEITTGNAQLAIVWSRLKKITGDERYAEAAQKMVSRTIAIQRTSENGPIGGRGAITGSFPLWGRYEKFAYPNWAQKYFADAILAQEGIFIEA